MTDTAPRLQPAIPPVEAKHPPAQRPGTVDRVRLVRMLMAEPGPSIVWMIAPPGYGKTTLLAQWKARERRPVAWLSLDDLDNDPAVLLSYLAVAFDRIESIDDKIRIALAAPRQRILATAVPRLASELHRWGQPAVLVLDDVHRLADRTCLDALAVLLDHLPPGFRVVIAGRTEPDLPVARFRAQRELLEIGRSELALDEGETAALAASVGFTLSPDEIRALMVRTEGWAAGIYLATLARERGDVAPGPLVSVSGRDRYIAAYFRSELERDLSDDSVTILTRTAILETIVEQITNQDLTPMLKVSSSLTDVNLTNKTKPLGGVRVIGSWRVERVVMVEMVWMVGGACVSGWRVGIQKTIHHRDTEVTEKSSVLFHCR